MNLKQNLIRMGQYGTKHAHAGGILQVMLENKDVEAEGILQHSGYYYKLTRLHGAPKEIPKNLIIFKWQSYLTFITGILLLIIMFMKILKITQNIIKKRKVIF